MEASSFIEQQSDPQPVDVTITAADDSILCYGAAQGELDRLQPLRTTDNGTMVIQGGVSVENVIQAQCEAELVGKTAEGMYAALTAIQKEQAGIHDTILALCTMQERAFKSMIELLESINRKKTK